MIVDTSQSSTTRRTLTYSAQLLGKLHLDGPLLVGIGLIAMVGLFVLYSASGQSAGATLAQGYRLILGAVAMVTLILLPFVLGGLTIVGLADTWLDFRRRLTPATGGHDR